MFLIDHRAFSNSRSPQRSALSLARCSASPALHWMALPTGRTTARFGLPGGGDVTGDLMFTPLVLLWGIRWKLAWKKEEAVEVSVLLLLLALLSAVVFGGWLEISAKNYPIAFICGPIVIWTAFRFTQRETATGI